MMKNNYYVSKWSMLKYQPNLPLGENGEKVTGSGWISPC